jgi:hypothetical protein
MPQTARASSRSHGRKVWPGGASPRGESIATARTGGSTRTTSADVSHRVSHMTLSRVTTATWKPLRRPPTSTPAHTPSVLMDMNALTPDRPPLRLDLQNATPPRQRTASTLFDSDYPSPTNRLRDPPRRCRRRGQNEGPPTPAPGQILRIFATTSFITSSAPPPIVASRESTKARAAGFSQM